MSAHTQIYAKDGNEYQALTIEPRFEALLPPLTKDEISDLTESITNEGVRDPLVVWKRGDDYVLLDGHNRYRIADQLPWAVAIELDVREFKHESEAAAWIIQNQFARRNLPGFMRVSLALKLKEVLAEARANGIDIEGRLNERIGQMADLSHEQVRKVQVVVERAPESLRKAAERGDVSTHRAYQVTRVLDEAPVEVKELVERHSLDDPDTVRLLTRLRNDNRESFWDLYHTGYLQPGDEGEAVAITDGLSALQEGLRRSQNNHIHETIAAKDQDAIDANGDAELRNIEIIDGDAADALRELRANRVLVSAVLIGNQSGDVASRLSNNRLMKELIGVTDHSAVFIIRTSPRQFPDAVVVAGRAGLHYAGGVLITNPERDEWAVAHILGKSEIDLKDRDRVVVNIPDWEWQYEAWAQLAARFASNGSGITLFDSHPAFATIGAAHVLNHAIAIGVSDERALRATAATFHRLVATEKG